MADFTINSLTSAQAQSTDNFIKSDANGAYTKIPYSNLKTGIIAELVDLLKKDCVLARGSETVAFSNGVGQLTVDLSDWTGIVDAASITAEFLSYANENGVVASVINNALSAYTFKLATVNTNYNGNNTIRYRISGKVSSLGI